MSDMSASWEGYLPKVPFCFLCAGPEVLTAHSLLRSHQALIADTVR